MDNSIDIIAWTIIGSLATIIIFLFFIKYIISLYSKKHNEFETAIYLKNLEKERSILSTRIEVQEETIQKISKELHDNINQLLTLAKLTLNNIREDNQYEKIDLSKELITNAINEITNMSNSLSSQSIHDLGILRTIELESDRIMKINDTKITIHSEFDPSNLVEEEQLILYRIFQESIRNALTHGNAKNINIAFSRHFDTGYKFEITDDGSGFESSALQDLEEEIGHQGLKNIKKRAAIINAEFEILSEIGKGSILRVIKLSHPDVSKIPFNISSRNLNPN